MIKTFKQFILENLSNDEESRLRELGLPTIDIDQIANATGSQVNDNKLIFTTEWNMNLDDLGIDSDNYRKRISDFYLEITVTVDFDQKKISASGNVRQEDMGLDEMIELDDLDWGSVFQMGEPDELTTAEVGEALDEMMDSVAGFDDPTGLIDAAREIVTHALLGKWTDELHEKKRLKWHDSDAPDAKGKFKELGVQKLADWLIRTRGGNMQKITGSLNQQINFNKKKNPSYAKKMESTREAVKRKLAKRNK
jgi:hypothetical protein